MTLNAGTKIGQKLNKTKAAKAVGLHRVTVQA
jgi:hypothetical protein